MSNAIMHKLIADFLRNKSDEELLALIHTEITSQLSTLRLQHLIRSLNDELTTRMQSRQDALTHLFKR